MHSRRPDDQIQDRRLTAPSQDDCDNEGRRFANLLIYARGEPWPVVILSGWALLL